MREARRTPALHPRPPRCLPVVPSRPTFGPLSLAGGAEGVSSRQPFRQCCRSELQRRLRNTFLLGHGPAGRAPLSWPWCQLSPRCPAAPTSTFVPLPVRLAAASCARGLPERGYLIARCKRRHRLRPALALLRQFAAARDRDRGVRASRDVLVILAACAHTARSRRTADSRPAAVPKRTRRPPLLRQPPVGVPSARALPSVFAGAGLRGATCSSREALRGTENRDTSRRRTRSYSAHLLGSSCICAHPRCESGGRR